MRAKLGTLEWGLKQGGATSTSNKILLLRNLAIIAAREATDAIRERLGLLKVHSCDFSALKIPDTRLTRDAESFACETQASDLLLHSYRTYYFSLFFADHHQMTFDQELLFAAAILHDTGLTGASPLPVHRCCFAVSGGKCAEDYLLGKSHSPEKVRVVADAISAHLNLHVPAHEYGPVAYLVAKGATCDAFGFGRRRIDRKFSAELLRKYPRGDVYAALLKGVEMAPESRPAFFEKLTGGLPDRIWLDELSSF